MLMLGDIYGSVYWVRMETIIWVFPPLLTLALSFASADIDNCLSSGGLYSAPLF